MTFTCNNFDQSWEYNIKTQFNIGDFAVDYVVQVCLLGI